MHSWIAVLGLLAFLAGVFAVGVGVGLWLRPGPADPVVGGAVIAPAGQGFVSWTPVPDYHRHPGVRAGDPTYRHEHDGGRFAHEHPQPTPSLDLPVAPRAA